MTSDEYDAYRPVGKPRIIGDGDGPAEGTPQPIQIEPAVSEVEFQALQAQLREVTALAQQLRRERDEMIHKWSHETEAVKDFMGVGTVINGNQAGDIVLYLGGTQYFPTREQAQMLAQQITAFLSAI